MKRIRKEILSSNLTFFFKMCLIPLGGVTVISVALMEKSEIEVILFGALYLAIWYAFGRIKTVTVVDETLIISNYFKRVIVPRSEIEAVWEKPLGNIRPIYIRFRNPTAFGRQIYFMPKTMLLLGRAHPTVEYIRLLARSVT